MSKTYPVGIVGEANYQGAIRRCSVGERAHVLHEPDNPYDTEALVVVTEDGQTLGYIARDCWLQDCIHEEGKDCEARIKDIVTAGNGQLGVVLDVTPCDGRVRTRAYNTPTPKSTRQTKGWLARFLGL